jgi:hypothetical protein
VLVAKEAALVDERLATAITTALRMRHPDRGVITKSYAELLTRLREDGVEFARKDLYATWAALLKQGTVARRPDVGYWLGSGHETLWPHTAHTGSKSPDHSVSLVLGIRDPGYLLHDTNYADQFP